MRLFPTGTILFPKSGASTFLNHRVVLGEPAYVSSHLACIVCDEDKVLPQFAFRLLCNVDAREITPDQAYPSLRTSEIGAIEIPLPPLDVQKETVEEINQYQKVIDGARAVVENYRAQIDVDPEWPMLPLGEAVLSKSGDSTIIKGGLSSTNNAGLYPAYSATGQDVFHTSYAFEGDGIVISAVGARCGKCFLASGKWQPIANTHVLLADPQKADTKYIWYLVNNEDFWIKGGSAQPFVKVAASMNIPIPLPPLEIQKLIVAELEAEQALVQASRDLIVRMEEKIEKAIARVWVAAEAVTPGIEELAAEEILVDEEPALIS